jgi:hypothetical protein
MATFTAHIPAIKTFKAHNVVVTCDAEGGNWTMAVGPFPAEKVLHDDVTAKCCKATNWAEIKAQYFPMYGFHA